MLLHVELRLEELVLMVVDDARREASVIHAAPSLRIAWQPGLGSGCGHVARQPETHPGRHVVLGVVKGVQEYPSPPDVVARLAMDPLLVERRDQRGCRALDRKVR